MKRVLLIASAVACLAAFAQSAQAATIQFSDAIDGSYLDSLSAPVGTAEVVDEEVVKDYLLPNPIFMKVMDVDGVVVMAITEKITNSTNLYWSDFKWILTSSNDLARFETTTLGEIELDGERIFSQDADDPTFGITYTVNLNNAEWFIVEQVDLAQAQVPAPGVGVALAGLAMMLGFRRVRRRRTA